MSGFLNQDNYKRFIELVGKIEPSAITAIGPLGLSDLIGEAALSNNLRVKQTLRQLVSELKDLSDTYKGIVINEVVATRANRIVVIKKLADQLAGELQAEKDAEKARNIGIPFMNIVTVLGIILTLILMYLALPGNWPLKQEKPAEPPSTGPTSNN